VQLDEERQRLLADTQRTQADAAETSRQVDAARKREVAAATHAKANAPAPDATAPAVSAPAARATAATAPSSELRQLRVQAFVSEQRMQFEALLQRLRFTLAQRQAFDRINEDFYRATLDEKLDASGRQEAKDAKSAALRELFGADHDAWLEANRQQSARAMVDQIVHQTFPSSGALNAAQADELTRIVDQHRLSSSGAAGASTGYDWERIIADARTILADRQMDDFIAAVRYRRASEQMSAMAASAKR
jgi:hypothetical protein